MCHPHFATSWMYWWDCPCVNRYCYKLPFAGFVPDSLKRAIVKPLRNKAFLDSSILKHVRPVWSLLFESELLKTVVLSQLLVHVVRHSTERTLYQWRLVGHRALPLHVYYLDYDRRIFLHVAEWRGWPLESFADCFVCLLWCACWEFRLDVCSVKMADIRFFTPVSTCWTYVILPTEGWIFRTLIFLLKCYPVVPAHTVIVAIVLIDRGRRRREGGKGASGRNWRNWKAVERGCLLWYCQTFAHFGR